MRRVARLCFFAVLLGSCAAAPPATHSSEELERLREENTVLGHRLQVLTGRVYVPDPQADLAILREENASLRQQLERRLGRSDNGMVCTLGVQPRIDGQVVACGSETIVIDKGSRDGVLKRYVFDVYRGTTYKGQARVIAVHETTCEVRILSQKAPMDAGDMATTQL